MFIVHSYINSISPENCVSNRAFSNYEKALNTIFFNNGYDTITIDKDCYAKQFYDEQGEILCCILYNRLYPRGVKLQF